MLKEIDLTEIQSIGIASFGPLSLDPSLNFGTITSSPKLKWQGFPLFEAIRSKTQLKYSNIRAVNIDTDVNAAAWVEFTLGNHNVKSSLAYVTVGTGVGVGYVINNKTVHGLTHPEGGHILVR